MMLSKCRLYCALGVCVLFCACASGNGLSVQHPPRSAQYEMTYDWQVDLRPGYDKYLGSLPLEMGGIRDDGKVTYAASSLGRVVAIDNASAQILWENRFDLPVSSGPVLYHNAVFIGLSSGAVVKLDRRSGKEIWRFETHAALENSISVDNGIVACVNANNRVFVLDEQKGSLLWKRERPRSNEFSMYGQSAPLIDNDLVYAGFSDGFMVAYALKNGTAVWSRELAPNARFKDLDVKPLKIGQTLFVASSSGGLYALSADDGRTLWQRDIFGISDIRAFQNSLYLTSQSGIIRLDQNSGDIIWQNIIQKEALISPLALGKNNLYAAVQRLGIVVIDRTSGDLKHIIDHGSDYTAAPVLSDGFLTLFSNRATIYRYFIDDKPL